MRDRRRFLVGAAAGALALVACRDGEDGKDGARRSEQALIDATIAPPVLDGDLPPVDAIHVEPIFGGPLADMDLRLTNRGGLIDRRDGYVKSVDGNHYALYVEPVDDDHYGLERYIDNLIPLVALVGPELMRRYPGLVSYDICQEPEEFEGDSAHPPPFTQFEGDRALVESVDWQHLTLDEYVALDERGAVVYLSPSLRAALPA